MSGRVIQGWHSDPFGVHEARYFSAGQPTKLVRDRGTESYDEPPSEADAVAAAMARLSPPPVSAPPAAYAPRDAYPYGPASGRGSRRRASGIAGFAASGIIVVAAAVAAVLVAQTIMHPSKHPSPSGAGDVALVNQAATRTLQQRTADVVLFISTTAGGADAMTLHGAAAVDLSGKAGTLNMTGKSWAGVLTMREIWVNGYVYLTGTIGGRGLVSKGKTWITFPISSQDSGATDLTGGNLTAALVSLENQGNTVRALGTKVIGGVSCTGYSVTSPDGRATTTVWINPQNLVREISGDATLADALSDGASASAAPTDATSAPSVDLTMDFSYSATPLHVTAPLAARTVS